MTTTKTDNQYTLEDIGCYVDGAKGIYVVDDIVRLAEGHGMKTPEGCGDSACPRCAKNDHVAGCGSYTEWSRCRSSHEVEDECAEFMNNKFPVDGALWGYSWGDWGLWPDNED